MVRADGTPCYMALWLPHLATDRLRRIGAGGPDRPLVTTRTLGSGILVAAVDPMAAGEGITLGMTLASARSLHPGLQAEPVDDRADAALLARLADWCERFSPLVATAGRDRLVIDATGCAHLFDGEGGMLADALSRLRDSGFSVRGAVAPTPGAAAALALHGPDEAVVADSGALATALSGLSVASLSLAETALDADALDGLRQAGLRRLGDLYGLPRAALATRFGLGAASALDRLLGRSAQPVSPRRPAQPYRIRLAFPDPIGLRGDIDRALERLVARMADRLQADAKGCRRLTLTVCRADGTAQRLSIGTGRPLRAPAAILRLFREKLETIDPGHGIDCLTLAAPVVEPFETDQLRSGVAGGDHAADADGLATLCDRLANRLGDENLFRLAPADSRLPDAAQTTRPALPARMERPADWPRMAPRPPSLLPRPQALTPLHAPPPGDPLLAFRLRGRRHAIRRAVGPERIAPDWWRGDEAWTAGARDYWRVEDEDGNRFWIYRDGVAGPTGDGAGRQHWYVQGTW